MNITPADILEKAAEILETEGHIKGQYGHHYDIAFQGHCALGALRCAGRQLFGHEVHHVRGSDEYPLYQDTVIKLQRRVAPETSISHWNDWSTRKSGEVIDALKHLAKDLRNEGKPS